MACIQCGFQLTLHFSHGHHAFAIQMTTSLGKSLIFNLNHGCTRTFKVSHGALRIEGIAKASIGIHNDRHLDAIGDVRQGLRHFGGCGEANVRSAQAGVGNRRTRQIQGFKAGLLSDQSTEGIVNAGG